MVLSCGAHHRRATDVYLLNALVDLGAGVHRFAERIEVDHNEVERFDLELLEGSDMLWIASVGKQSGVNVRVQRLHPAIQDFGKTRDKLDRSHRDAFVRNRFGGRPRGDDVDPGLV